MRLHTRASSDGYQGEEKYEIIDPRTVGVPKANGAR